MTGRFEDEGAGAVEEWLAAAVQGRGEEDGILEGERWGISDRVIAEGMAKSVEAVLDRWSVGGVDGEMNLDSAVGAGGIECGFEKVFLEGGRTVPPERWKGMRALGSAAREAGARMPSWRSRCLSGVVRAEGRRDDASRVAAPEAVTKTEISRPAPASQKWAAARLRLSGLSRNMPSPGVQGRTRVEYRSSENRVSRSLSASASTPGRR